MSIIVNCDKTGIQFDADSKRQKNHPQVSALLNEAARDKYNTGAYNVVLRAFATVKTTGGYTIDEAIAYARSAMSGNADAFQQKRQAAAERERQMEQARRDAKAKREAQNAHLRAHGYAWSKTYANFDEYEEGEPSQWTLFAPDGVAVDEAQALEEIARGANVVRSEIATKEAEATAKVEAANAEEEHKKDEFKAARSAAISGMVKVQPFIYGAFTVAYEYTYPTRWSSMYDRVYTGTINGVNCAVTYSYIGGHDWVEYVGYYCADPALAGLEPDDHPEYTIGSFFGEVA